jgi:hypothetical protein
MALGEGNKYALEAMKAFLLPNGGGALAVEVHRGYSVEFDPLPLCAVSPQPRPYSPHAAKASLKARSPGAPFSMAMMARRWLT